jgi:hypothetical protein
MQRDKGEWYLCGLRLAELLEVVDQDWRQSQNLLRVKASLDKSQLHPRLRSHIPERKLQQFKHYIRCPPILVR